MSPHWQPSPAAAAFARDNGLDPDRVAERFRNHWLAKAGPSARQCDWRARWENWCLEDVERQRRANRPSDKRAQRRADIEALLREEGVAL